MSDTVQAYKKIYDNLYVIYSGISPCERYITSYLIVSSAGRAIIIDPGPHSSGQKILKVLDELGLRRSLETIIPTHVHLDHAGASVFLARETGAAILAHPRGIPHLKDPTKLWEDSRRVQGEIVEKYERPLDGENVEFIEARDNTDFILDDIVLRILHTPGHASHHISIFWQDRSILFTGDSAGIYIPEIDSIIPTTPPPFRYDLYVSSLKKMILLNPREIAFTHREIRANEGVLEKHLNQMRIWLETFLVERDLKNRDPEEILRVLAERDYMTLRYLEYEDKDCIIGLFNISLSIRGFLEEISRLKSL
ncbi:MAG: MBL fold metallo-hydrolase [Sulfolobales archaeon]